MATVRRTKAQFTTGIEPDTTAPVVVRTSPTNGATDVPVNVPVILERNEPINPALVTSNTVLVTQTSSCSTSAGVEGSYTVSADGRQVSFVPDAPLVVGQRHSMCFANRGVRDLVGNRLLGGNANTVGIAFTTAFAADTTGPQVVGVSPADGLTAVPTNVKVQVAFDEPIQTLSQDQVILTVGGSEVLVQRTLSDANRLLTLKPLLPLDSLTGHTLTIDGVKDLAGNPLAVPVISGFTTAASIDLDRPVVVLVDPSNGAVGVPTNAGATIQFSERMNPLSVTPSRFMIERSSNSVDVPGTVAVAADGLSATFTPTQPLEGSTSYRVVVFSNTLTDVAGNTLFVFNNLSSTFTTAP